MKNLEFLYAINGIDNEFITEAADDERVKEAFCAEWGEEDESEQTDGDTAEETQMKKKITKRTHKVSFKKMLLVAVISMLLFAMGVTVSGKRIDDLDILKDFGYRIVELFVGERVEYEGIDIIKENESIKYESIEEFFKRTNYDVLYPSKLPKEITIKKVILTGSYDSYMEYTWKYKDIAYLTNRASEFCIICNTNPDYYINLTNMKFEIIDDYGCYILNTETFVQCTFIYENNTYHIEAPTYEDIVTIVSGMKKYDE